MMAEESAEEHRQRKVVDDASLVNRLVEFTFRILNTEMEPFFNEHCMTFDQEGDDLQQRGETLEQFAAFKLYEKELERHLNSFTKAEGFKSVTDCFATINSAVKRDLAEQEQRMKELTEHIRKTQAQWLKASRAKQKSLQAEAKGDTGGSDASKAAAKGGSTATESSASASSAAEAKAQAKGDSADGAKSDAKGGAKSGAKGETVDTVEGDEEDVEAIDLAPMMMFYQPITLEQLVQTVLSVGEYQTFSMMMRMKVRQLQMMRKLRQERKLELRNTRSRLARLRAFDEGGGDRDWQALLEPLYDELRTRLADLTPHRIDLREAVQQRFDIKLLRRWLDHADMVDRDGDAEDDDVEVAAARDGSTRSQVLEWLQFMFQRLAALCSWSHSSEITQRLAVLMEQAKPLQTMADGTLVRGDAERPPLRRLLLTILKEAHEHVDR